MILLSVVISGVIVMLVPRTRKGFVTASYACGVIAFIILVLLFVSHLNTNINIQQYWAVKATIASAREEGMESEIAHQWAITELNAWLSTMQYQNSLYLIKDFIPDEVDELEPLR